MPFVMSCFTFLSALPFYLSIHTIDCPLTLNNHAVDFVQAQSWLEAVVATERWTKDEDVYRAPLFLMSTTPASSLCILIPSRAFYSRSLLSPLISLLPQQCFSPILTRRRSSFNQHLDPSPKSVLRTHLLLLHQLPTLPLPHSVRMKWALQQIQTAPPSVPASKVTKTKQSRPKHHSSTSRFSPTAFPNKTLQPHHPPRHIALAHPPSRSPPSPRPKPQVR